MKKNIALVIIVLVALGVIGYGLMVMFEKGDVVKPLKPVPIATTTEEVAQEDAVQDQAYCAALGPQSGNAANSTFFVSELQEGDPIVSGYLLRGCVKNVAGAYGNWAPFEGQIGSYVLYASDNTILAQSYIPVSGTSDWMTMAMNAEHIPYEALLSFDSGAYTSGYIVIKNENASGMPEFDKQETINVAF